MNKKLKLSLLIIVAIVILFVCGCSKKNAEPIPSKYKGKSENIIYENKDNIKENKKLTDSIKNENDVLDGSIYAHGENAVATMVLKDSMSKEEYNKVANKYLEILKKNYKGMKINVQAVQKGQNVVNINYTQ